MWFEKSGSRNLVHEIWLEKNGSSNLEFFSGSRKVVDQKKGGFIIYIHVFLRLKKSASARTTFLEPLFYTFREKWLQIKWLIVCSVPSP